MKSIMYHYIQDYNNDSPYFNFLDVKDFEKQILYFKDKYNFIEKDDFLNSIKSEEPVSGVLLTFDDGLKCHYDYVLPILVKYKLFGIFYIPTDIFNNNKLINVHRIHHLIGSNHIDLLTDYLLKVVPKNFINPKYVKYYGDKIYYNQNLLEKVENFKLILNYYIKSKYRNNVIDSLMSNFCEDEVLLKKDYYLSKRNIKALDDAGMIIGSHSVDHPVLSKLNYNEQNFQIQSSFYEIEKILGAKKIRTFCYPYGGFRSFNITTEKLLDEHSVLFSFNVEPRDISSNDLKYNLQKLPRYDCNAFPYGSIFDYSK